MTNRPTPTAGPETDPDGLQESVETRRPESRVTRRRVIRSAVWILSGLVLLLVGLPSILAWTGTHDVVLTQLSAKHDVTANARSASLGWTKPVSLHDLDMERLDQSWSVRTETFSTDKTLLQWLFRDDQDFGTVELHQPHVVLRTLRLGETHEESGDMKSSADERNPRLRTIVRNGSLEIHQPDNEDPVVEVDEISFVGRTEVESGLFVVEPVRLLDRRELTRELCDRGLQLIAPLLAEAAYVNGQVTVDIDEFQVPIGNVDSEERIDRTRISGLMRLHEVETGIRNPLMAEIAAILSAISGGRPTTVRLSEDSQIRFRVDHGRVYHEGLVLLIPELSHDLTVTTSGWVDLDENIDIRIRVDLSGSAVSAGEVLRRLTGAPLELVLTGTIQRPRLRLPAGRSILEELSGRLDLVIGDRRRDSSQGQESVSGAISDLVGGLLGDDQGKPDVGRSARGVLDLIQTFQKKTPPDSANR